jgi:LacI family transcriptional regulator
MKEQNPTTPTLTDVARLAGVSRATVSSVMRGHSGITAETAERVTAAITQLRYRPSLEGRSIATQRSGTFGFVSDEIVTTPYAGKIFEGAQDTAWQQGKLLILANTKNDPLLQAAALDMMLERQVEGIIYATFYHRPVTPPDLLWELPAVLLDCFVPDRSLPSVVPDEVTAAYTATSVLLDKGHKRVGFLNNRDPIPATSARLEGYSAALADHGIPFDPILVTSDSSDPDGGMRSAETVMQVANPPTALFCFNDRMAMGAYYALRKLNLSIPDDVAVMGFDNHEIVAASLNPGLSTMQLPHYEMGKWAFTYLLTHVNDTGDAQPIQHIMECPYVERSSV